MAESYQIMRDSGFATQFVANNCSYRATELMGKWDQIGLPYIRLEDMQAEAKRGDLVLVCADWGRKPFIKVLDQTQRKGVKVIGLIEGTRFQLPGRYERADELLVWGPSGEETSAVPAHIVGSPGLEGNWVGSGHGHQGQTCLINYKFTFADRNSDQDFDWLKSIMLAADNAKMQHVISLHPANDPLPAVFNVSDKPLLELMRQSRVVVTRTSTVVYQALLVGIPVILYPIAGEELAELGEPMGAYEIAQSSDELSDMIARIAEGRQPKGSSAKFLERHISTLPHCSSSQRIAEALKKIG